MDALQHLSFQTINPSFLSLYADNTTLYFESYDRNSCTNLQQEQYISLVQIKPYANLTECLDVFIVKTISCITIEIFIVVSKQPIGDKIEYATHVCSPHLQKDINTLITNEIN